MSFDLITTNNLAKNPLLILNELGVYCVAGIC